jgi:hypothetical protein
MNTQAEAYSTGGGVQLQQVIAAMSYCPCGRGESFSPPNKTGCNCSKAMIVAHWHKINPFAGSCFSIEITSGLGKRIASGSIPSTRELLERMRATSGGRQPLSFRIPRTGRITP